VSEPDVGRDTALFLGLVLGLQHSGMIALGKLKHPVTNAIEVRLDLARDTIDTLEAIEARTRGNLSGDEARALRMALDGLRLNYLDEAKKAGGARVPDADPGPAGA
jgi:hypothetical protein